MAKISKGWQIYLAGVVTGCVIVAAAGGVALMQVRERGLAVAVDTDAMATAIEAQVEAAIRQQTPVILSEVRQEVVARVGAETERMLQNASIDLGGFKATLPAPLRQRVQAGVQTALATGMERALSEQSVNRLSGQMGDRTFVLVRSNLDRYLTGTRLVVRPWPWYSVPVVLTPL